ncbi:M28 family peptidase [Pseudoduganella sp. FT26W]|uniref:M28 family peptidase n=1 Tax=Duganella aquatilis TaxID=2666082 RepID=A0A844CW30_9BURK|nr:M28 family peptidase [Duganella aquatilis]MRW84583.1 M28 family peptidase [Duganella aquatilis]
MQRLFAYALTAAIGIAGIQADAAAADPHLTPDTSAALDRISADSLRGHLSFIASDLLEGRGTPSRGQDLAAEYIAAQFRRAGLEAVGDDGYFQTAHWKFAETNLKDFSFQLDAGKEKLSIPANLLSFSLAQSLTLAPSAIVKIEASDAAALDAQSAATLAGKVVVTNLPDFNAMPHEQAMTAYKGWQAYGAKLAKLHPALLLIVDRVHPAGDAGGSGRLIDPESGGETVSTVPRMTIHSTQAIQALDALGADGGARVSVHVAAPVERAVKLRNVIGVLRGSDPVLKDTYVMVTAHYDHLGIKGGKIYNGANDDGSGTVSVMEIAGALAGMKQRPARSIVFMTVFGEELGLFGSRYYGRHPILPIKQTVADVNLEQVGRTDSSEGPQLNNASMTGFDFSDVGAVFQKAGKLTGINVYKNEANSDFYFGKSDNQALADQGVPAHTLCVAYEYPDYHGPGDHWEKVDYANMAKVDRMVALGVLMIANDPVAPKWNTANALTKPYVEAWTRQSGQ